MEVLVSQVSNREKVKVISSGGKTVFIAHIPISPSPSQSYLLVAVVPSIQNKQEQSQE